MFMKVFLLQFYSPAKVESDQKDIIIAQLKADIFELRKSEEDFYILQDELRKMELKIKLSLEERQIIDAEHRARHEQALKQINQLRNEIQQIQQLIQQRLNETDKIKNENLQLSELCDMRQLEIQNARRDFNKAKDDILIENEHLDRLQEQQILFEEETRAAQLRNKDLQNAVEELRRRTNDREKLGNTFDKELSSLNQRIESLNNEIRDLTDQVGQSNAALKNLDNQNLDTVKKIRNTENKLAKLEEESQQSRMEAQRNNKNAQIEQQRNGDLQYRVQQLENLNKQRDGALSEFQREFDQLNEDNKNIIDTNEQMKDDWEKLQKHIEVLIQDNQDLLMELDHYCDDDDKVKAILNRRNRVKELSIKVLSGTKLTSRQIKQSPLKQSPLKQSPAGLRSQVTTQSYSGIKKQYSQKGNY